MRRWIGSYTNYSIDDSIQYRGAHLGGCSGGSSGTCRNGTGDRRAQRVDGHRGAFPIRSGTYICGMIMMGLLLYAHTCDQTRLNPIRSRWHRLQPRYQWSIQPTHTRIRSMEEEREKKSMTIRTVTSMPPSTWMFCVGNKRRSSLTLGIMSPMNF